MVVPNSWAGAAVRGGAHPITTFAGTSRSCTITIRRLPSSAETACMTASPCCSRCSSAAEISTLGLPRLYCDSLPLWKCGSASDDAPTSAGSTPATARTANFIIEKVIWGAVVSYILSQMRSYR